MLFLSGACVFLSKADTNLCQEQMESWRMNKNTKSSNMLTSNVQLQSASHHWAALEIFFISSHWNDINHGTLQPAKWTDKVNVTSKNPDI